jgi:hypothetical protein
VSPENRRRGYRPANPPSPVRAVFCPTCGAKPGAACITNTGGKVKGYHPARKDALEGGGK